MTENQAIILREMWTRGATTREIGNTLRISTSTVAQWRRSLGLPARERGIVNSMGFCTHRAPAPRERPYGAGKLLLDVPHRGCRWPTGLDERHRHLFCGQRITDDEKSPYCPEHRVRS